MTLNGWRLPKRGRWRVELAQLATPSALTCATIVAVLAVTTDGAWLPVTSDIRCALEVVT